MSVVLGVDPSLTVSGCALVRFGDGDAPADPVWETWRARAARPDVESVETNRKRIRTMLREILAIVPPRLSLSVVEGPAMAAKYTPLADERAGLRWMLIDQLMARGPVVLVTPSSRQSLAYGEPIPRGTKSPARKALVTEGVREMVPGAHVPDHNVADAVAMAAAGAHRLGLGMPYVRRQLLVHANVAWPVESVAVGAAGMGMGK